VSFLILDTLDTNKSKADEATTNASQGRLQGVSHFSTLWDEKEGFDELANVESCAQNEIVE
jgi:hypothetical protein